MVRTEFLRTTSSRLALCAALVLAHSGTIQAQEPATASNDTANGTFGLLPITILGNQEDATGPVTDMVNPPTVTGSKVPLLVNEIPQSVTILGDEDLERFGANRVSEALRYTPGLMSDVYGDDNDTDWIRIRGFQADQNGVYLDNAQNLAFAFGSFYTDPYALERIEVLRGPSSALYGGSNPGGLVNYVSKRPGSRIREAILGADDARAGSVSVDYGDPLGDGHAFRFISRVEGGDKYDAFNSGARTTLAPSYRLTTKGGTELTFLTNLHIAKEKHNGSTFLPYHGTVRATSEFGYIGNDANFSDPSWDHYERQQFSTTAIAEHTFANDFTATGIFRTGIASIEERYYYPFGYKGFSVTPKDNIGTLSLIGFEHDTLTRTAQTDLRYYGTVETGMVSHDLLFGMDARYYWINETQASGIGKNRVVNPINPGAAKLGAPYQDANTMQSQIGFYLQDQLRFGDGWILTGNMRHDFVETEQDGAKAFKRDDSETSYRTAVAYAFDAGITPYVSYATSFNPRIASTTSGVTKPETGDQIEFGVKWAPGSSNFYANAAIFKLNRKNVVTGIAPKQKQLGQVRSQGVELEGGYNFRNGLRAAAGATFLDQEVTKDLNASIIGKTPTLTPENQLSLRADYAFNGALEGLNMGAGIRRRGESFADKANKLVVPASTVFDMSGSYEIVEGKSLNIAITNLTDKRYVTGCASAYMCSYGSGREISFSLKANW